MSTNIKSWEEKLKSKGYTNNIEPSHWNEEWLKRRHVHVLASDGSILEITRENEYIRIVASDIAPTIDRPFALYRLHSTRHPDRPKTDFLFYEKAALFMSAEEITLHVMNQL